MDPITIAILAGIAAGAGKVGGQLVEDAYGQLKELLKRKFGTESKVLKATEDLEANPGSKGRSVTLGEEVMTAKANEDPDLVKAAEALLAQLKTTPAGSTVVTQTVTGGHNIFSGTGPVTVTGPRQ